MNSWRNFWTAGKARVRVYTFVLLPLVAVALVLAAAAGRALIAVVMAVWVLCAGAGKDAKDAVRFLRDNYRDGMKQAKERGGVR